MIRLVVCGEERKYGRSLVSWVREQFWRRRSQGDAVWFRVILEGDGVSIVFSSKNCPGSVGRRKVKLSKQEKHFVDLWDDLEVGSAGDVEKLIRFLQKATEMIK
jgi:hypothetical protein